MGKASYSALFAMHEKDGDIMNIINFHATHGTYWMSRGAEPDPSINSVV